MLTPKWVHYDGRLVASGHPIVEYCLTHAGPLASFNQVSYQAGDPSARFFNFRHFEQTGCILVTK